MPQVVRINNPNISVSGGQSTTSSGLIKYASFEDAPDIVYGSGIDGSVVFDGTTTILSMAPSSSVYTLTRDIYCLDMTVNASVTIKPAGYRIFVQGVLTMANASLIGYTTGFSTAGSIAQGGAATTAVTNSLGGASATQTATAPIAGLGGTNYYKQPLQAVLGWAVSASTTTPTFLRGGAGGSTGVGGGVVILSARYMTGTGTPTIKAMGTTGANGGGGGVIIIISSQSALPSEFTTDVTGGNACAAGTVHYIQVL